MISPSDTASAAAYPGPQSPPARPAPGIRGARILVVDDDRQILRVIRSNLVAHGYEALEATSGEEALDVFVQQHPDLVILDLGLPGIDGLTVIERLREQSPTPIVILSARGGEPDKVRALDLGADDYLTKPFGLDELLARVRVALRHAARPTHGTAAVIRGSDLEVNLDRRRVAVRGQEVHLSPTEYELLKLFVTNPDRVLTHHWLLQRVWGPEYGSEGNYLHVYVAGLRKKVEENPKRPRHLRTEPGVGYRFHLDPAND